uniref:hypothetical protein n=1 Tax=Roseivirga sp. TaxID=1964215 RepID=UPI004047FBAB
MIRFRRSHILQIVAIITCLVITSCENDTAPESRASNPGLFINWTLIEEDGPCNQGGVYTSTIQGRKIELNLIGDSKYEYIIDNQLIQNGSFIAQSGRISFTPAIYPNGFEGFSSYVFTGTRLVITTTELLNPGSTETCEVRRVYRRPS